MEITNKIKSIVFASYVNSVGIQWVTPSFKGGYTHTILLSGTHIDKIYRGERASLETDYILVLKALSSITDEDARGIKILGTEEKMEYKDAKHFLEFYESVGFLTSMEADFLRNLGYDMPHYLLGGKTLQESGLAIYEKQPQ